MAIYAIGDLHLSFGCDKPMDIFPGWDGYIDRLTHNWRSRIEPEDTVVLAGDTSWSMRLENCREDFSFLQSLPGRKLILKGNHDYWWSTMAKMESYIRENAFNSIAFLYNNSFYIEGICLCGTRSWMHEPKIPQDAKVMAREAGRLRASLQHAADSQPQAERVVFLHYPPLYPDSTFTEVVELMKEFSVRRCYYGHLHGSTIRKAIQGEIDGIQYQLISADALQFSPVKIH